MKNKIKEEMNKKIDIEKLDKRNPFSVSEDYFTTLTHNIMDKIEEKETFSFLSFFQRKTVVPTLSIIVIIFSAVWMNYQNPNITDDNLIELLTFYDVEEELILEYIDFQQEEEIDEYIIEEYNYSELIYEL
jgi:hypothetical protein|tara:strand:- start:5560 stop:5952 length:393 start_codon:yes stop_codon:yes gene_type:complete